MNLKEQNNKSGPKSSRTSISNNDEFIVVRGAKAHNLKNLSLSIPRNSFTVITGLSGSGKSSLAFDTIFAEAQRRYVESLSTYARQFVETLDKPDVESIEGLSPSISIQQKTTSHNPRSTVGTVTEVYDYLRLLYARISKAYCLNCNKPIASQSVDQIVDAVLEFPENSKLNILAPIARNRKGEFQKQLSSFLQKGFSKVRIDGQVYELTDEISLDKQKKHNIDLFIDRLILRKSAPGQSAKESLAAIRTRLFDSIDTSIKMAEGLVKVEDVTHESKPKESLFSTIYACADCGISYPTPEPRTFSFNSPMGACEECNGIGYFSDVAPTNEDDDDEEEFPSLLRTFEKCSGCLGTRLKKESLSFRIKDQNIAELGDFSISRLEDFFKDLDLTPREKLISERIVKEIQDRVSFLNKVGAGYLSLSRTAQTLSGGESQRIRLATQLGSSLVGVLYVLDEPSIGLHQRDNDLLLESLENLRDKGNTVLVVEHDKDTIERADHVIDLGPGAGTLGGELIAEGTYNDLLKNKNSITGKYLSGELEIETPKVRRPIDNEKIISLRGVMENNLKGVDVDFPLGVLTCVTGVSGSGKSTLVLDTLYRLLMERVYKSKIPKINLKGVEGLGLIDKVIDIDQKPIGRTPRSNPSTYTGTFSLIRDLFSNLPESRMRGFKPGRFSFNIKGGRCEKCQGGGLVKVEMHFLSDVYVRCEDCGGRRYNDETLSIHFKEKSIADVLEMTIQDASKFFENIPVLSQKLRTLNEVGLGYVTLGQSATTLSGGEAQRMKLAKELAKRPTGKTVYILDEPSTGLHFDDIKKLNLVLHRLVDQGNTVIIIEHNLEIIKTADYIIDLGPDGGEFGGEILFQGTPEELVKNKKSETAKYLKEYL